MGGTSGNAGGGGMGGTSGNAGGSGSGAVRVDATWNLTCPAGAGAGCGSVAEETCLGAASQRTIAGAHREPSCTGDLIITSCEAVHTGDEAYDMFLEVEVGGDFALQIRPTAIDPCNVTIVEDGLPYDLGACGIEAPSMEQPCQILALSAGGGSLVFGLECHNISSSTTGLGFDVGAVGGGPTWIRFENCIGF